MKVSSVTPVAVSGRPKVDPGSMVCPWLVDSRLRCRKAL